MTNVNNVQVDGVHATVDSLVPFLVWMDVGNFPSLYDLSVSRAFTHDAHHARVVDLAPDPVTPQGHPGSRVPVYCGSYLGLPGASMHDLSFCYLFGFSHIGETFA